MNEKKKRCRLLLGYCPFLACTGSRYSSCIVTQRLGRLAWPGGRVTIQTLYRGWGRLLYCNMAAIQATTRPRCATIRRLGLQHARQRARMALVLGVLRYSLRHGRLGLKHVQARTRHGRACPATRRPVRHYTVQRAPRHDAVRAAWAHMFVQGVHLVHPT